MTRDDVRSAMSAAGLIGPRVMLHRTGTGSLEFLLTCGFADARRQEIVPVTGKKSCKASSADVEAAIARLSNG